MQNIFHDRLISEERATGDENLNCVNIRKRRKRTASKVYASVTFSETIME